MQAPRDMGDPRWGRPAALSRNVSKSSSKTSDENEAHIHLPANRDNYDNDKDGRRPIRNQRWGVPSAAQTRKTCLT